MGCSTRHASGENYLIDPALQLLDTAVLINETCALSTTYLFDDKNSRPRDQKGAEQMVQSAEGTALL
jgi:hypothetical protein